MFYVSSRKGMKFGITDTEDGVEEFYTRKEIINMAYRGIEIAGVNCSYYNCYGNTVAHVDSIGVSDFAENFRDVKAKLINGYVYNVKDGVLKTLRVCNTGDPVKVELGAICKKIDKNALRHAEGTNAIFVFDDRIESVHKYAFQLYRPFGNSVMDFHLVTRFDLLCQLYYAMGMTDSYFFQRSWSAYRSLIYDGARVDRMINLVGIFVPDFYASDLSIDAVNKFAVDNIKQVLLSFIPDKCVLNVGRLQNTLSKNGNEVDLINYYGRCRENLKNSDPHNRFGMIHFGSYAADISYYCGAVKRWYECLYKFFRAKGYDEEIAVKYYDFTKSSVQLVVKYLSDHDYIGG